MTRPPLPEPCLLLPALLSTASAARSFLKPFLQKRVTLLKTHFLTAPPRKTTEKKSHTVKTLIITKRIPVSKAEEPLQHRTPLPTVVAPLLPSPAPLLPSQSRRSVSGTPSATGRELTGAAPGEAPLGGPGTTTPPGSAVLGDGAVSCFQWRNRFIKREKGGGDVPPPGALQPLDAAYVSTAGSVNRCFATGVERRVKYLLKIKRCTSSRR